MKTCLRMVVTPIAPESSPKRCPIDDSRPGHLHLEPRRDFGEVIVEKFPCCYKSDVPVACQMRGYLFLIVQSNITVSFH